jgi:hypothetical protein
MQIPEHGPAGIEVVGGDSKTGFASWTDVNVRDEAMKAGAEFARAVPPRARGPTRLDERPSPLQVSA